MKYCLSNMKIPLSFSKTNNYLDEFWLTRLGHSAKHKISIFMNTFLAWAVNTTPSYEIGKIQNSFLRYLDLRQTIWIRHAYSILLKKLSFSKLDDGWKHYHLISLHNIITKINYDNILNTINYYVQDYRLRPCDITFTIKFKM